MRAELFHPLLVHFPIALLVVASAVRFVHVIFRNNRFAQTILVFSWVLLFLGVAAAWLAILAGEVAESIVRATLCRPDVLDHHQQLAYTTAIIFSGALVSDVGLFWLKPSALKSMLVAALLVLYLSGVVLLVFTGGFGGSLVYDQGAAVEKICSVS